MAGKSDDKDSEMVDELDRNGNPTGRKVRSGGDEHAEPSPPGGPPPGRGPAPDIKPERSPEDEAADKERPLKKK
jgi:hypothetical protein